MAKGGDERGKRTTFTITGGVGSVRYALGAIATAAGAVQDVAEEVSVMVPALEADAAWLARPSRAALSGYPSTAVDALYSAATSCRRVAAGVLELAEATRTAVQRYDDAEARATRLLHLQQHYQTSARGLALILAGPLAPWVALNDLARGLQQIRERGLRDFAEGAVEAVAGSAGDVVGVAGQAGLLGPAGPWASALVRATGATGLPAGTLGAVGLRAVADAAGLTVPGTVVTRRVPEREWKPNPREAEEFVPADGAGTADGSGTGDGTGSGTGSEGTVEASVRGVLSGSADAYTVAPSAIIVRRIDRSDGSTAWLANLPGTESWWPPDGSTVWDLEGDLEGLTSAHRVLFEQQQVLVEQLLRDALRDAGATPADEVLLAGHSGGGIHAAAAAADPAFLAEVNVKFLILAGAPSANAAVSPTVGVLDLQNRNDLVAAADLRPPPDLPSWISATSTRPATGPGTNILERIGAAHDLSNYLTDAAALDTSTDPSVLAYRSGLAAFLGVAPGSPVRFHQFVYQGTDVPSRGRKSPERRKRGDGDVRSR